jgi:hypothetical protein
MIDSIARAYLEYLTNPSDERFDAWVDVDRIVHNDPEQGWQLMLRLVELAANDDEALMSIGAGPLEDLLTFYPFRAEEAEEEAKRNLPLRRALSGARYWGNPYGDNPAP